MTVDQRGLRRGLLLVSLVIMILDVPANYLAEGVGFGLLLRVWAVILIATWLAVEIRWGRA